MMTDDLIAERTRLESIYTDRAAAPEQRTAAAQGLKAIRAALEQQQAAQQREGIVETGDPYADRLDGGMFVTPKAAPVQWWGPSMSTWGVPTPPKAEPVDMAKELERLVAGGGAAAVRGAGGKVSYKAPQAPELYDLKGLADRIGNLAPPEQRKALAALQAANPEVNRENFTGKNDVAMRGVSDALLSMAGGLADPNKSFAQALTGAGERGFKSYDDREDKAVKEQTDARNKRLDQGKELNAAELADFTTKVGLTKTQGDLGHAANTDAEARYKSQIANALHAMEAMFKQGSLDNQGIEVGARLRQLAQNDPMVKVAMAQRLQQLRGRLSGADLENFDRAVNSVFGHAPKDDGNPYAQLIKTLGEEKAKALVLDPANTGLSIDELMAKAIAGDKAKIGQPVR